MVSVSELGTYAMDASSQAPYYNQGNRNIGRKYGTHAEGRQSMPARNTIHSTVQSVGIENSTPCLATFTRATRESKSRNGYNTPASPIDGPLTTVQRQNST
jgi:hypothetical protein